MARHRAAGVRTTARALAVGALFALAASLLQGALTPAKSYADTVTDSATSSTVTVAAKDVDQNISSAPMPNLKVTVSQTQNLTSQAVAGSGLSNTVLTPQTLTVTGNVYDYAAPNTIASPRT